MYLIGFAVVMVLAGLELRSGTGILWKRKPGGPIKSGIGVALILGGIIIAAFAVVLGFSPQ
jgi:hypothetical protein